MGNSLSGQQYVPQEFQGHTQCPSCESSDAFAIYSSHEGKSGHCFACNHHVNSLDGDQEYNPSLKKVVKDQEKFLTGQPSALKARGLTQSTCSKWGYLVGKKYNGKPVQIAQYYKDGRVVGQKIRDQEKNFLFIGAKNVEGFYGQWLFRSTGKKLVITEGEIDALSFSQVQDHKWPVVSIPNGAQSAVRLFKEQIDYLEGWEEVIIAFDGDKVGREAAIACASILSPGRCKIIEWPTGIKDANDMLQQGKYKEMINLIWEARPYRPDGIKGGDETWDSIKNFKVMSEAEYPWECMNTASNGMRKGELVTHTAGTGIGKSTACREIAYSLGVTQNQKVGIVALEENVPRSVLALMSLAADKQFHLDDDINTMSDKEKKALWKASAGNGNFFFYDHWGSLASDNLLGRIKYMIQACGCDWIILDHISIVVSGMEGGDERRSLDNLMTNLRSLVEQTGVGMHLVSHLKRGSGGKDSKTHEEGGQISLQDLRGSQAIAQLSDMVWTYERNQQSAKNGTKTIPRLLKNRYSGVTGAAGMLEYIPATGRMVQCSSSADSGGYLDELDDDDDAF